MPGRKQWQTEYFHHLAFGQTIRVAFDLDRGRAIDFTVQFETWLDRRWRPVVRYEVAHGRPHRDVLDRAGRQVSKDWLPPEVDLQNAMEEAVADIKRNWATYLRASLETSA